MDKISIFKELLPIAFGVIAASVAIFNWRASRFRGKLKDDLEIQKRYREELQSIGKSAQEVATDEHYVLLQAKIIRKMQKAYLIRGTDWSDAAIACAFSACAVYGFFNDWSSTTVMIVVMLALVYAFFAVRHKGKLRAYS